MADRNLSVKLRADVSEFKRGMSDAARATEQIGTASETASKKGQSSLSRMAQSARENRDAWTTVGTGLTTYGAAVAGVTALVGKVGIEYNTLRQRAGAALETMTGSAEAANAQMDKLDDFASNSPFSRDVFIKAQQQMFGFRIESEKVIPYLDAIQNAVAATGGSNQDISELSTIFSQVSASAKITATDLREFGNRGIDAATLIGSQMGLTGAQIREQITAGTLDAGDALDALAAGMQDTYGGAAENVKNTMLGAVDRVKAAFRDLSSDLMTPFVDPTGGGIAVDGLNRLADALRAFQGLPDGVKQTAGAIGLLSGAASLGAGGFLLLAPRIVDTVDALRELGIVTPGLGDKMKSLSGTVAKGGALVIGLGAVATALQLIEQSTWRAAPGVEEVTAALLDIQDVGNTGQLDSLVSSMEIIGNGTIVRAAPVDSLADAIQRLDNPTALQRMENLDKVLPGVSTSGDRAAEALGSIDGALVGMVNAGDAAGAMAALESALEGTGVSAETAMQYLPGFKDALIGVENEAREAANATGGLADTMIALPEGVPTKLERMRDAGAELAGSMTEAADSFVDFSKDVDNAEVSLDKWLQQLLDQAAARDAWVENMRTLAEAGLDRGFWAALQEQGPAGAMRVQQMVDEIAAGRDVASFNQMGRELGSEATAGIVEEIAETQFPTMELQAALDRQAFLEDANAMVRRTPEQVEVARLNAELDMDDHAARLKTAETVLWAAEQTGIMDLDADDFDARFAIDNWNGIAANTTGLSKLNADPRLALAEVRQWVRDAEDTVATSHLDAEDSRGRRMLSGFVERVRSADPVMRMFLNDDSARATMSGFFAAYQGTRVGVNIGFGNADGGFHDRGVRYADGGIDAAGQRVPRVPMMGGPAYGKRDITWGEDVTTWEAYISGKPGMEARNRGVLEEAARRMGLTVLDALDVPRVHYANGGMHSIMDLRVTERDRFRDQMEGAQADYLASIGGGGGGAMAWPAIWALVRSVVPGAIMTSNYRPGSVVAGYGNASLHGQGRAVDFVSSNMAAATALLSTLRSWTELIHTPAGMWQQNRGRRTTDFLPITKAMHYDHVHVGAEDGGLVEALSARPKVADTGYLNLSPGWNPPTYNGLGRDERLVDIDRLTAALGPRFTTPSPSYSPAPAQSVDSGVTAQLASLSAAVASIPDRIVVPVSVGSRPVALASREGEAALGARSSWGNGKRLVT